MEEIRNFVRGDIWWGIKENAQGSEQSGYRPYIVASNNSNNKYSPNLTVVPLTTQDKKQLPTHCDIYINDVKCIALGEQIMTLQKSVFNKFVRRLSLEEFSQIEQILKVQLGLVKKEKNNKKLIPESKKSNIFTRFFKKIGNLFKRKESNKWFLRRRKLNQRRKN